MLDGTELFKEQYRGFPDSVWMSLQRLHDQNNHWDDNRYNHRHYWDLDNHCQHHQCHKND